MYIRVPFRCLASINPIGVRLAPHVQKQNRSIHTVLAYNFISINMQSTTYQTLSIFIVHI